MSQYTCRTEPADGYFNLFIEKTGGKTKTIFRHIDRFMDETTARDLGMKTIKAAMSGMLKVGDIPAWDRISTKRIK